ncbi:hypothetical protein BT63DRAFT_452704 [Microthyrium microscopicum]|uniref:Uncharacterized protein n=1 Tax=Microthyrium microscopicum TaxID=703497 RepID=A0A6A6UIV3_9PEZI|nr:hypothetical protein BT63DRAFT_452704 [Microthyrium microscopicum]
MIVFQENFHFQLFTRRGADIKEQEAEETSCRKRSILTSAMYLKVDILDFMRTVYAFISLHRKIAVGAELSYAFGGVNMAFSMNQRSSVNLAKLEHDYHQ